MNDLRTLISLELRSLFGINKFRHTRDKKAKNRYRLLCGVWVFILLMMIFYVGALVFGLCYLGLGNIVPCYLTVISSILIFAFGLFDAGHTVFEKRGYDILTAMPIRPWGVVCSRFAVMYFKDILMTLIILLPGISVYAVMKRPNVLFYLTMLIGALFIPALPLVASTVMGTIIMSISSRMKNKSIIQSVLVCAIVIGIIAGSFSTQQLPNNGLSTEALKSIAQNISELIGSIYAPALWLSNAARGASYSGLLLFVLLSAALMAVCLTLTSRLFPNIMRGQNRISAKHNYTLKGSQSRSMLRALYAREFKRYFSSSIYVTNTMIGPIMGCVLSVAIFFIGIDTVQSAIPIPIAELLPFALSAVFCMMTTTSTSISMEGKQILIIKSLPIPIKAWLDSKVLLNLSLILPFYVISEVFLILATAPSVPSLLWLILIPLLIMLFSTVFGITVNLKLHSFDWEKEGQIVKQSASAALGGFAGMILSLILGVLTTVVPIAYSGYVRLAICAGLAVGTLLLYTQNNKKHLEEL